MGQTLALASSDGRFNVTVAGDDVELVAAVLILLEVSAGEQLAVLSSHASTERDARRAAA
jgi:hypothetical protein